MKTVKQNYLEIMRVLVEHEVDFIVVGGVCGVLHGAPIVTFDLDVVHSRKSDNLHKLMAAMQALDAYVREPGDRILRPKLAFLSFDGPMLLMTRFGPFDLIGTVEKGLCFDDLTDCSEEMEVDSDLKVLVLDLEWLIRCKEEAGREKDRAVLPILRQTLAEKIKRQTRTGTKARKAKGKSEK